MDYMLVGVVCGATAGQALGYAFCCRVLERRRLTRREVTYIAATVSTAVTYAGWTLCSSMNGLI